MIQQLLNIKDYNFPTGYRCQLFTWVVDGQLGLNGLKKVVEQQNKLPPLAGEDYIFPVKGRELMKLLFKDADNMAIATLSETRREVMAHARGKTGDVQAKHDYHG